MQPEHIAALADLERDGYWAIWISGQQRNVLRNMIRDEEVGDYYTRLLAELKDRIATIPKSYGTRGQGNNAIVYLHYFRGSVDSWITEQDSGDPEDDDRRQHQAYGRQSLHGGPREAEIGYISIEELIQNRLELDLHWTPEPAWKVFSETPDPIHASAPTETQGELEPAPAG